MLIYEDTCTERSWPDIGAGRGTTVKHSLRYGSRVNDSNRAEDLSLSDKFTFNFLVNELNTLQQVGVEWASQ